MIQYVFVQKGGEEGKQRGFEGGTGKEQGGQEVYAIAIVDLSRRERRGETDRPFVSLGVPALPALGQRLN